MKALSKLLVLLAAFVLASCGGGGGGSQGAFTPTPADTITINPAATSIPANSFTTLTVTVKKHDGSIENDGTVVNASVSPLTVGTVSGSGQAGTTASNSLSGGKTSFVFNSSSQGGTATISISLPAGTNGSTTAAVATQTITVTGGNGQDPRLQISASPDTLPVSPYSLVAQSTTPFPGNFLGSPYITEVTLTFRRANGQLISSGTANVSISPANVAGLSLGSSPTELQSIVSSGTVTIAGGVATVFVHAGNTPGTAILTATTTDPDSGQAITSQLSITVAGSGSTLASSVTIASPGPVYISNSGGPQSTVVTATVKTADNALVADPNGFDNIKFEIVGPAGTDARLSGVNAAGQTATGTSISTVTHNGVAAVSFLAGTQQGPVQVRATVDRGDNNIDNGVQDAVSATATVVVSDGILYSLTISTPVLSAITVNRVSTDVTVVAGTLPNDPNATYSLRVSATATDRQGNPPIAGTVVKFGSIDAPQTNGFFSIAGTKGDPQEGGTGFTAADGHFKTAGGGAGPGDTLVVFGKQEHGAPAGNEDLESAVKVASVQTNTSLTVATAFNRNDTTGVSVNNGPVLPYVIGRSQSGNISSPATTNAIGVASTTLNYPVSVLGRALAIWAQGTGIDNVTGGTRVVTDAELLAFPGVAPATISVSPNPIPGNLTLPVVACIIDAAQNPISGVFFTFNFQKLGIGNGSLDGISTSGVVPDPTGPDGCVTTTVTTNGIDGTTQGILTFSYGDATKDTPIVAGGNLILLAVPSSLPGNGGKVTLQLLTSNGTPVPGVQIVGTCTGDASIGITSGPGITDSQGKTTAQISANLDAINGGKSGSCTFTTSTGTPKAVVTLQGINSCTLFSPPPAGCTGATSAAVTINIDSGDTNPVTAGVSSNPAGINCSVNNTLADSCPAVTLASNTYELTPSSSVAANFAWSGSCTQISGTTHARLVLGTTDVTCTLIVTNK